MFLKSFQRCPLLFKGVYETIMKNSKNGKNGLLIFLLLLIGCKTLEVGVTDVTIHSFENNYNNNDYENIFQMFSMEFQESLPLDLTKAFFTELKSNAGNIIKYELIKKEQNKFLYRTTFENGEFVIDLSVNDSLKINGLRIKEYMENAFPIIEQNLTALILPFTGEWYVVWGGDTIELNYHVENMAQKNAFDFVIMDEGGKTYKTNGLTDDDYYAFEKEIIAPCDGEIVLAVDGIKDNEPGKLNPYFVFGNTVIIKTDKEEYIVLGHFKQNSIIVKEKEYIKKGDIIGYCGNSGNSSEPHLHFHIQNTENIIDATGVKCYFDKIIVNGNETVNYSPIKNDKIRNR
jgi:hypothetical protein